MAADGGVAASRASARAAPSPTWWPTPGKTSEARPCAARRTHCSTPPPTAFAGCSAALPRRRYAHGPVAPPDHDFVCGARRAGHG